MSSLNGKKEKKEEKDSDDDADGRGITQPSWKSRDDDVNIIANDHSSTSDDINVDTDSDSTSQKYKNSFTEIGKEEDGRGLTIRIRTGVEEGFFGNIDLHINTDVREETRSNNDGEREV